VSESWAGLAADREPRELSPERCTPRTYVTKISVPHLGNGGVQRLIAPMKQPEPEPEAGR
jgi:hypothetical protein